MKKALIALALIMFSFSAFAAQKVLLLVRPGCQYCAEAKMILNKHRIPYQTKVAESGPVPRLYIEGKYYGTGSDAVLKWVKSHSR